MKLDNGLRKYATGKKELECFDAVVEHGSQVKAAAALKVTVNSIQKAIDRVRIKAAEGGYSPDHDMTHEAAPGFGVDSMSFYYKATPTSPAYWLKLKRKRQEMMKALEIATDAIIEPARGIYIPGSIPKKTSGNFMALYPVAEPHMGMYSWKEETGADYDTDIAEKILVNCMGELVDSAPASDVGFIVNLADYFHMDDADNRTRGSGNVLDVDGRWGKVFWVGVRAKRELINLALKKHKKVIVKSGLGNHDEQSVYCLMSMMHAYFENEPRVEIHLPNNPFAYHQFGRNLIGIHHGNGVKAANLPMIMAADQAAAWGETDHRVFLYGHIHHKTVKEHPGCIVESFRSIAAKDSWHNGAGYRAGRAMECIIFDKDGGEHGRRTVNVKWDGESYV